MTTIRLTGTITKTGELDLILPEGLPPGEVQVTLEIEPESAPDNGKMTGQNIVAAGLTGGWADKDIDTGQSWLEEQRHSRAERREW